MRVGRSCVGVSGCKRGRKNIYTSRVLSGHGGNSAERGFTCVSFLDLGDGTASFAPIVYTEIYAYICVRIHTSIFGTYTYIFGIHISIYLSCLNRVLAVSGMRGEEVYVIFGGAGG